MRGHVEMGIRDWGGKGVMIGTGILVVAIVAAVVGYIAVVGS